MGECKNAKLIKDNLKQLFLKCIKRGKANGKYFLDQCVQTDLVDDSGYEDLTPATNIKNGDEYLKALHWGLGNRNVKNIALTGPYGSGKSSIIKSYLNRYPRIKALNISLATFD